ncbi:hypothetical protein LR48_Vigan08g102900 [Vigna angularis]|uniref:Uncharacterized protein n=1 Tax=Phaseolus angularis TaxID=3914 RepID=A0A0L9V5H1_PHAAN|nr:hypothetical protein LR48_Vigan08g102900 [Vigna angularis]
MIKFRSSLVHLEVMAPAHRPSTSCPRHPDEAFTSFCLSCLCERLALLDPNNNNKPATARKPPSTTAAALKALFRPPPSRSYAGQSPFPPPKSNLSLPPSNLIANLATFASATLSPTFASATLSPPFASAAHANQIRHPLAIKNRSPWRKVVAAKNRSQTSSAARRKQRTRHHCRKLEGSRRHSRRCGSPLLRELETPMGRTSAVAPPSIGREMKNPNRGEE